jgi:tRNA A37 threonylcarbamoyladenosine dehydratase
MRQFTKSMMSYTWAMSLFGVQQAVNIFRPRGGGQQTHPSTEAFNNVTEATEDEFSDTLKATFRAGDNLQRGMVDLMFSVFTLGVFDRNGASCMSSNAGQQSADTFRQGMGAMRQTAEAFGQTVQGAASAASWATQQGATGWGPVGDMGGASNTQSDCGTGASQQQRKHKGGAERAYSSKG